MPRNPQAHPIPARAVIAGRGLRYRDVAVAVGCNPHTFGRIMNGHVAPWPAFREGLAELLDLPESELFDAEHSRIARLIGKAAS